MEKEIFENLLSTCLQSVQRYVYFKLPSKTDADDVLQEVYLTAFQKRDSLKDHSAFKAWMIRIAQNKCNDYFRNRARQHELPLDETIIETKTMGRYGIIETNFVQDTIDNLSYKSKQILYLYFFKSKPQAEIAKTLDIPLGTVKSRLHAAKQEFKKHYPYPPKPKGEIVMKKLPDIMPEYNIVLSDKKAFTAKWEEVMGWFLVPKLDEKLSWGIYDSPSRKCNSVYDMRVTGKAEVHGIEGVELTASEYDCAYTHLVNEYTFVAQLTETHCRYLSCLRTENGVRKYITFLDEDAFMPNWGFGENNCGNEINIKVKGDITRDGNSVNSTNKPFLLDIVGRYTVEINGKSYDTVCVMDIETYNSGVVSEQYLDQYGKTVLWRRFNRDDWAIDRYKKKWSKRLPNNECLVINGEPYIHWYDCITDYIL